MSHISDHYGALSTKNETLERFSASLLPGDHLIVKELMAGYNHFRLYKDIRKYFVVSVQLVAGTVRFFLPFEWTKSSY